MNERIDIKSEFLELLRPVKEGLWKFCLSMSRDRCSAEDALSQTILEAFAGLPKLQKKESFKSWIYTIARRICIRRRAESKRLEMPGEEYFLLLCADTDEDKQEEIAALYFAIDKLPEVQKEAIILFEINGLSRKEIAEIQESNVETVKKRLSAGREKLKQLLTSESDNRDTR